MRRAALLVIAVAAIALMLAGCGTKVPGVPNTVASVNGENISAADYLGELSKRVGKEALSNMIEQKIVLQWAKDEGVPVTDAQINDQIEMLKRDGIYDAQLKVMGDDSLNKELENMQARINLAKKFYKFPDNELEGIYTAMKDRYVHGPRKQASLIINPDKGELEKAAKSLKDGKEFDEVAAEYTDRRFSMSGPITVWIDETKTDGLPAEILNAAKKTKTGEVTEVVSFGQPNQPNQYAILKITQDQPKANKTLKDVKEEVTSFAALQKSQSDPDFMKKLNERKKKAEIAVNITDFKDVIQNFKNPPDPMPFMSAPQQAPPAE